MRFSFPTEPGALMLVTLCDSLNVQATIVFDETEPCKRRDHDEEGFRSWHIDHRSAWIVNIPDAAVPDHATEARIRNAAHKAGCHSI